MHRASFVSLLLASFVVHPLAAQDTQPASFDVTVGIGEGWGGAYAERTAFHAELTFVPGHSGRGFGAFALGARLTPASNDRCSLDPSHTTCLEEYPAFAHVAWLGGVEAATSIGAVRAAVGPAVYAGNGFTGFGGQLNVDASAGFSHAALVVAARGGLVGRVEGAPLRIGSLEAGIRLR